MFFACFRQFEDRIPRYPYIRKAHLHNGSYPNKSETNFLTIGLDVPQIVQHHIINQLKTNISNDTYLSTASTYLFPKFL